MANPWEYSKSGWTGLWAAYPLKVPLSPNHSIIVWFYDLVLSEPVPVQSYSSADVMLQVYAAPHPAGASLCAEFEQSWVCPLPASAPDCSLNIAAALRFTGQEQGGTHGICKSLKMQMAFKKPSSDYFAKWQRRQSPTFSLSFPWSSNSFPGQQLCRGI